MFIGNRVAALSFGRKMSSDTVFFFNSLYIRNTLKPMLPEIIIWLNFSFVEIELL